MRKKSTMMRICGKKAGEKTAKQGGDKLCLKSFIRRFPQCPRRTYKQAKNSMSAWLPQAGAGPCFGCVLIRLHRFKILIL